MRESLFLLWNALERLDLVRKPECSCLFRSGLPNPLHTLRGHTFRLPSAFRVPIHHLVQSFFLRCSSRQHEILTPLLKDNHISLRDAQLISKLFRQDYPSPFVQDGRRHIESHLIKWAFPFKRVERGMDNLLCSYV